MNSIVIIVPILNEKKNIEILFKKLKRSYYMKIKLASIQKKFLKYFLKEF